MGNTVDLTEKFIRAHKNSGRWTADSVEALLSTLHDMFPESTTDWDRGDGNWALIQLNSGLKSGSSMFAICTRAPIAFSDVDNAFILNEAKRISDFELITIESYTDLCTIDQAVITLIFGDDYSEESLEKVTIADMMSITAT